LVDWRFAISVEQSRLIEIDAVDERRWRVIRIVR
jgi:hypothetical protein